MTWWGPFSKFELAAQGAALPEQVVLDCYSPGGRLEMQGFYLNYGGTNPGRIVRSHDKPTS